MIRCLEAPELHVYCGPAPHKYSINDLELFKKYYQCEKVTVTPVSVVGWHTKLQCWEIRRLSCWPGGYICQYCPVRTAAEPWNANDRKRFKEFRTQDEVVLCLC